MEYFDAPAPVFNYGRHLSAFTIEDFKLIESSAVIKISTFRTVFTFIANFLGGRVSNLEIAKEIAERLAIARLKLEAQNADYIINLKMRFKKIGRFAVSVHAYATAIYMYKDTLPLFNLAPGYKRPMRAKKARVLATFICSFFGMIAIFIALSSANTLLSKSLVKNFSSQDEDALWSYLKGEALTDQAKNGELLNTQDKLNELLQRIPNLQSYRCAQAKIYIIDEPYVDVVSYPGCNITVYKNILPKVKSEDAMMYLIANEFYHLENHDYMKGLQANIVNIYFAVKFFGEDSFIGKFFTNIEDLWNVRYTDEEKIAASTFALNIINSTFGHIGGYLEFNQNFSDITQEYQDYLMRHPENSKTMQALQNYIDKNNLVAGETNKTVYFRSEVVPKKLAAGFHALHDEFTEIFEKHETNVKALMEEYQSYIASYHGLLDFPKDITKAELEKRYDVSFQIQYFIQSFSSKFYAAIDADNEAMVKYLASVKDEKKNLLLKDIWNKDRDAITAQAKFYFLRDQEYLSTQQAILSFLTKRYGTYEITENGIKFDSITSREKYIQMLAKLEELVRRKPPLVDQRRPLSPRN
jgi:uncharacterized protein YbjQ (UPF0145 family)